MTLNPWLLSESFDALRSDEDVITVDDTWRESSTCARLPLDESTEIFFPEEINEKTLSKARRICRICPVFEECREWGEKNFPAVPDGILFGFDGIERGLIYHGRTDFHDWRWDETLRISRRALAAREREALRKGVPAVVNAYRYYEIDDPKEKERAVVAYKEWQDAQRYPSTLSESVQRVQKLANAWLNIGQGKTRRKSLPPEMRPPCPEHGGNPMYRQRSTGDGRQVWKCLIAECQYKVIVGEPTTKSGRHPTGAEKPACPNGHRPQDMESRNAERCYRCYVCKAKVPFPESESAVA